MDSKETNKKGLIGEYHVLEKRLAQIQSNAEYNKKPAIKARLTQEIKVKMAKLGGLETYQKDSLKGEEKVGFDSSFFVTEELNELYANNKLSSFFASSSRKDAADDDDDDEEEEEEEEEGRGGKKGRKLTLLDVGAIRNHYPSNDKRLNVELRDKLKVASIDLNASLDSGNDVIKADFFQYAVNKTFDAIVLSLVLNFVGDVKKRGIMLKMCEKSIPLNGFLFIVLPRACTDNSRYLNDELFKDILKSCGFHLLKQPKKTAKLQFFVCQRTNDVNLRLPPTDFSRIVVRDGIGSFNNFCIMVQASTFLPNNKKSSLSNKNNKTNNNNNTNGSSQQQQKSLLFPKSRKSSSITNNNNSQDIQSRTSNQRKRDRMKKMKMMKAEERRKNANNNSKSNSNNNNNSNSKRNGSDNDGDDYSDDGDDDDDDDDDKVISKGNKKRKT